MVSPWALTSTRSTDCGETSRSSSRAVAFASLVFGRPDPAPGARRRRERAARLGWHAVHWAAPRELRARNATGHVRDGGRGIGRAHAVPTLDEDSGRVRRNEEVVEAGITRGNPGFPG